MFGSLARWLGAGNGGPPRRCPLRLEALGDRAVPSWSWGETQTGMSAADCTLNRAGEEIPSGVGSGEQVDVFGGGNVGGGVEDASPGEIDLFGAMACGGGPPAWPTPGVRRDGSNCEEITMWNWLTKSPRPSAGR